jgi:hypothetical protein
VSERDDLRFQLLLLAPLFEDEPGRDLKAKSLILIDQVAGYASHLHHGLPQRIAALLALAMHAAMRGDTPTVIQHVELSLAAADDPPAPPPKSPTKPRDVPKNQPHRSRAAGTAKPIADAIDPLLAKLRAKYVKH